MSDTIVRSIIVYYAADGKAYLSDSHAHGSMNDALTWISNDGQKQAELMISHMKTVRGGGVYFFRATMPYNGDIALVKHGVVDNPTEEQEVKWRAASVKIAHDYLTKPVPAVMN